MAAKGTCTKSFDPTWFYSSGEFHTVLLAASVSFVILTCIGMTVSYKIKNQDCNTS